MSARPHAITVCVEYLNIRKQNSNIFTVKERDTLVSLVYGIMPQDSDYETSTNDIRRLSSPSLR